VAFSNRTNLVDESVLRIEDKEEQSKERKAMVWYLYVDMYCLDYDGNVFDACLIALLSALANGTTACLPSASYVRHACLCSH
jgi:exosome complex RNA-binding protein Rrp42 (RNase PH superfamily)